jgi:hypothetical protein
MYGNLQTTTNDLAPLNQETPDTKEIVLLRPHQQHQFHCDEVHRVMDINMRYTDIILHLPPYFQNIKKDC